MPHVPPPSSTPRGTSPSPAAVAESFADLAARYRVLFLDAYGVLKNSSGLLEGVLEQLVGLKRRGVELYVLTNDASKSPEAMIGSYEHPTLGNPFEPRQIVSSGRLAQAYLNRTLGSGRVAYFGKPTSAHYIAEAGLEPLPVSQCNSQESVDALAFLDDEGFDWSSGLNTALNLIRRRDFPVIVANPDLLYPADSKDVAIAAGGLASVIENIVGKSFVKVGKPQPAMFAHAFDMARATNANLVKSEVLMVGDTLRTDIAGAREFGIDTALVLSGNTQLPGSTLEEKATELFHRSTVQPHWLCSSVVT